MTDLPIPPIPRGADLTDDDIALISDDALVVCLWCMRHRMTRDRWKREVTEALRVRLGRRLPVETTDD